MAEPSKPAAQTRASASKSRMAFFRSFLRQPQLIGSLIPSSRFLERRLVTAAEVASAGVVVELGPGTGGTTQALLRAMRPDAKLVAIELAEDLAALLQAQAKQDARLLVHHGSAENLSVVLAEHGLAQADVVISGIPFSTMPADLGARIMAQIQAALRPGGRFVAYQVRGHVARVAEPFFGEPAVGVEFINVPPLRVYRWQTSSVGSAG
jgi:phosphatidylethanolamine/phosphatidyl-N-methylethanolamine N-methyltransferase